MDNLRWETLEYTTENGQCPVDLFFESLSDKQAAKIARDVQLLKRYGTRWGMPHVRSLPDGMYELRTKHGSNIFRTFFFRWHDTVLVLTSGYYKKSQKMDMREFKQAKRLRDDWLKRKGE